MTDYYKIKHRLWVKVPTEAEKESAIAYIDEHRIDVRPRAPYLTVILIFSEENDKKTQLLGMWESSICKTLVDVYGIDNIRMHEVDDIFAEIERVEKIGREIDKEYKRYEKVINTSSTIKNVINCGSATSFDVIKTSALVSISRSLRSIANSLENAYPSETPFRIGRSRSFRYMEDDEKGVNNVYMD